MGTLVIGGTGFIGTELCRTLQERGQDVCSLSRGKPGKIKGVDYISGDVTDTEKLTSAIRKADDIFILTGQVGPGFDVECERTSMAGIAEVLSAYPEKRVYFTSTANVYGETTSPVDEEVPCHPIEPYAKYKLEMESLLGKMLSKNQLVIYRIANVYGSPRNRGIVGLALKKLLEPDGKPLVVNGDGKQKRDYIFLDDVVEAMARVQEKAGESDIVNIASGESHTLLDVIEMIQKLSKKIIDYKVSNVSQEEIRNISLSQSKLREIYGYRPPTSLEAGIGKTIKRYQEYYGELQREVHPIPR